MTPLSTTARTLLVAALGGAQLTGCATALVETQRRELDTLRTELVELRKSQATMGVTVEDLETRLFLVQDELDTYKKRAHRSARTEDDLPVVRVDPRTESPVDAVYRKARDEARNPRKDDLVTPDHLLDDGTLVRGDGTVYDPSHPNGRPAAAPKERKPPSPPPVAKTAPPRPEPKAVMARPDPKVVAAQKLPAKEIEAMRRYQDAFSLYEKKRYEDAITGFREFVQQNPTHSYADNALYWMGECYYDRGLWPKALETFQRIIESFPLGNKVPDAMLKLGLCHHQLGSTGQAKEVLGQVRSLYPNTDAARIAGSRLELLP